MSSPILETAPLGFPWGTVDPFLYCVYHVDHYPAGDGSFRPAASLAGRAIGQDFAGKDGWRMYHGTRVPGFPSHPHRGFETVTIARRGYIDHSDSLGAAARFGQGDVQWLTAGAGIVHAEMFPMLSTDAPNTLEVFQIWLNLPAADKMADPHFSMLWSADIPRRVVTDTAGRTSEVTVIAGAFDGAVPPAPPPRSWASRPSADVAIWTVAMQAGAALTLPRAQPGTVRTVYFFGGKALSLGSHEQTAHAVMVVNGEEPLPLLAGDEDVELLVLQGRPIGEPVVQYGPFVMNTRDEIQRAMADYRRTEFGGWPWPASDPVHGAEVARFARHADGRTERR